MHKYHKEKPETQLNAIREMGLGANSDTTKSNHRNAGQNLNIKTTNKFFKDVSKLKHFTTVDLQLVTTDFREEDRFCSTLPDWCLHLLGSVAPPAVILRLGEVTWVEN
jgi:hypothetical protein